MEEFDDVTRNLADGFTYRQQDHRKCEEEGCDESGEIPCWIDDMDKPDFFYCAHHAGENGFCHCCGCHIAGWIEIGTLCDNCRDEIESNERDPDDDENYYCGGGKFDPY